jgi:hypothetical protein
VHWHAASSPASVTVPDIYAALTVDAAAPRSN